MPASHATAAILSVGDELTLGQTLDTNSKGLSERLSAVGLTIAEHATVPDDLERQKAAFLRLASTVDLIICTGGLGPTADDLTRQSLSAAMDDPLVQDPIALAQIESYFVSMNRQMPAINAVQALRPNRATLLPNLRGTAPGIHALLHARIEDNRSTTMHGRSASPQRTCEVFCLPGPPNEMYPMFEAQVLPRLRPVSGRCVRTLALHTIGLGESEIATRLGDMMARDRMPLVGTTASGGIVTIRLRFEGEGSIDDCDAALERDERAIRAHVGPNIFAKDADTLAHALVHKLRADRKTFAVVESCTGGLLASQITDVPGSSSVLLAGWIPYSNEAKSRDLAVAPSNFEKGGPGAVSHQVAHALAVGGLRNSGADYCLSITGIAGPEGGSADKPVGTVFIALATAGGEAKIQPAVESRRFLFTGDRASIRSWSARAAQAMLWMHLAGTPNARLLRQVDRVVG